MVLFEFNFSNRIKIQNLKKRNFTHPVHVCFGRYFRATRGYPCFNSDNRKTKTAINFCFVDFCILEISKTKNSSFMDF
jgi:hypothetical protein